MKESEIRKRVIALQEEKGWYCWYPRKVKFHESDIFGIGDLICSKKGKIKLIQFTTATNMSHRRKKIHRVLDNMELGCPIEIWAMRKDESFKVEVINQE